MTTQLLQCTTTPFEAIHFRQSARLVPQDSLTLEKQRLLARKASFIQQNHVSGGQDLRFAAQVRRAFPAASASAPASVSMASASVPASVPASSASGGSALTAGNGAAASTSPRISSVSVSSSKMTALAASAAAAANAGLSAANGGATVSGVSLSGAGTTSVSAASLPGTGTAPVSAASLPGTGAASDYSAALPGTGAAQANAAYTQQRGSFEMRVAKGELAYIPPMQMTVITSYPSVDFTYTGGFHYVPPSAEPSASQFAGEA